MDQFDSAHHLQAFSFDGEVAVVTGGALGMGYPIARTLAELGAKVVIADRDADAGVSNTLIWQS
ncbi:MAG: SDR family NAD(P)-dependent oxidoreductase [Pseudomonadales bacterium]